VGFGRDSRTWSRRSRTIPPAKRMKTYSANVLEDADPPAASKTAVTMSSASAATIG